ncbi:MAG: thioredoxin domain-containing protein [Candidatus Latescibacteria bacterium]|nr:thioredoxin domain-containing protein [Candidatus Latescibacterota bacterium]
MKTRLGKPRRWSYLFLLVVAVTGAAIVFQQGRSGTRGRAERAGREGAAAAATDDRGEPNRNRLANEKSPYLLQHANNPVDWFPWGEEAFARARAEDKPIFLSIGYSTCHWCHVMERESFENHEIAAILNQHFVSIKIDREERPDIDDIYMKFVTASTGHGGWPMSVWLTPSLEPFFGGTYFPPDQFGQLLQRVAGAWQNDRARVLQTGVSALNFLRQELRATNAPGGGALDESVITKGVREIDGRFDGVNGGFSEAPKFPVPLLYGLLFRQYARMGEALPRDHALFTLRKMAAGGIHDVVGGGFHRYSTDDRWHVPHFEKMLYDQSQLAITYTEAYQITRESDFEDIARGILEYVRRDMTGDRGQFFSAEDADSRVPGRSEHREGAFYVWTRSEIDSIVGGSDAGIFAYHYGVEKEGNVEHDPFGEFGGKNVLIVSHTIDETAQRFGKPTAEVVGILANGRDRLFRARQDRPRPHLDDKTLTSWNALMISAFARAAQVFDSPEYLARASAAAAFIRAELYDAGSRTLLRRYRDGEAAISGQADDYAFLVQALLDLYEASFDIAYFDWAVTLQDQMDLRFWDQSNGGYYATDGKDPSVLVRSKAVFDSVEPSANSVALLNLSRLAQMTDGAGYRDRAGRIVQAFAAGVARSPAAAAQFLVGLGFYLEKPVQIVIAGSRGADDTRAMLRVVHGRFVPNRILLLADGGSGQRRLSERLEFIRDVAMLDGRATAYVCENYVCLRPTSAPDEVARLLDGR